MHKTRDASRTPPDNPEVERYKALARLAEERARDIRRIAALERTRLEERLLEQEPLVRAHAGELERLRAKCELLTARSERLKDNSQRLKAELAAARTQLKALRKAQSRLAASRAHRLADAYVRLATGGSLVSRALRLVRPVARGLNRIRRALT